MSYIGKKKPAKAAWTRVEIYAVPRNGHIDLPPTASLPNTLNN